MSITSLKSSNRHSARTLAIAVSLMSVAVIRADAVRIQRYPSDQEGSSLAVRVANADLVHTTQLLPPDSADGNMDAQIAGVLSQLDRVLAEFQSTASDVVKLHLYVRDEATRKALLHRLAEWSVNSPPAVATVATALPDSDALVGIDAIFASRLPDAATYPEQVSIAGVDGVRPQAEACVLPKGDAIYISGQAEKGEFAEAVRATMESLVRTLNELQLDAKQIVQIKCYFAPMTDAAAVDGVMSEFFGDTLVPPVSLVEWTAAPWPIEIDLVAWAPSQPVDETVTFSTPSWMATSPVYSKVARVHGNDRIYIAGIASQHPGSGPEQVHAVFGQLQQAAQAAGSDMRHLVKATYYVTNDEVSNALTTLRPEYYDPQRPPAASKAMVLDLGAAERSLTLDMIAVPTPDKVWGD